MRIQRSIATYLTLGALTVLWFLYPALPTYLLTVFGVFVLFRFDPRILGGIALLLVAAIPFGLLYSQPLAAQLALYAFILLCMTALLRLFSESRNTPRAPKQVTHSRLVVVQMPPEIKPKRRLRVVSLA